MGSFSVCVSVWSFRVLFLSSSFLLCSVFSHLNFLLQNVDNSSIERVEEFKYFGTTLTNQNSIQEEIKSRLKLGNACHVCYPKI